MYEEKKKLICLSVDIFSLAVMHYFIATSTYVSLHCPHSNLYAMQYMADGRSHSDTAPRLPVVW